VTNLQLAGQVWFVVDGAIAPQNLGLAHPNILVIGAFKI